jgi:quercetin dioxygenase-like cupin family protein
MRMRQCDRRHTGIAHESPLLVGRQDVRTPLFDRSEPARVSGATITFEPGARTAWHTHPWGQTLIVTGGFGWAQKHGEAVQEIRPGDVVWFAPGEKHWLGARRNDGGGVRHESRGTLQ